MNTSHFNQTLASGGFMKAKDLYDTQKNSTKQIFDQIKKQQEVELQAINEKLKKL